MCLGRTRLPAERFCQLLLACIDDLCPAVLLVAESKPLLGCLEKGAKEGPLPFVPDPGTDRPNIDHGQDQEQPETLRALHLSSEILDCLGIGKVALEGGRGNEEVMADQPRDGLGLRRVEPESRAELQRNLSANVAVVAAAALGDVVEQNGDIENPP